MRARGNGPTNGTRNTNQRGEKMKLQKGNIVMVYEDPFTMQKSEGPARLVKKLSQDVEPPCE